MDGGAWWAAIHGVAKSQTRLHFHFSLSCIGEGNGNPLRCSCLENPRDGGAWWAAVCGVTQNWTRLKRLSRSSSSKVNLKCMWKVKTIMRYHLTPVRMTIIKKSTNNNCWRGCGEKGTLLHTVGPQTRTPNYGEQCEDSFKKWK